MRTGSIKRRDSQRSRLPKKSQSMRQGIMPGSSSAVRRFASDASEFVQQRVLFQQRPHQPPEFVSLNEQCLHRHHSAAESKKHHNHNECSNNKANAGNKDGEEQAAEDSLSSQTPSPSTSGVDKIGPRIAQEHSAGLSQDARLGGLVSLQKRQHKSTVQSVVCFFH